MANVDEKLKAEKAKSYKTTHDVERAHHLAAVLNLLRDHSAAAALSSSFARELQGMNMKQVDLDAEEKAAEERARPAPAPAPEEEEEKSNPTHPRRGGHR